VCFQRKWLDLDLSWHYFYLAKWRLKLKRRGRLSWSTILQVHISGPDPLGSAMIWILETKEFFPFWSRHEYFSVLRIRTVFSGYGSYLAGHYGSGSFRAGQDGFGSGPGFTGRFGSGSLSDLVTDPSRIQLYFLNFCEKKFLKCSQDFVFTVEIYTYLNLRFKIEPILSKTMSFFQEAWSSVKISNLDPTGYVITDLNPQH